MKWRRKKRNRRVVQDKHPRQSLSGRIGTHLGISLGPRLRRGLLVAGIGGAAIGLVWQIPSALLDMEGLALRQVRVEGRFEHISRAEVRNLVAPFAGRNFFDIDVVTIKQTLEQQPWVNHAEVRRRWPDGLELVLQEQEPVARWGEHSLVNGDAQVFSPQGVLPQGIPRLDGVPNSERLLLSRLRAVSELLQPLGLKIAALAMDERRSWRIELDNGLRLMLGRGQEMQRIQRFVAFYPSLLAARVAEVAVVDLRYPNGIALRWVAPQGRDVQVG